MKQSLWERIEDWHRPPGSNLSEKYCKESHRVCAEFNKCMSIHQCKGVEFEDKAGRAVIMFIVGTLITVLFAITWR